MENEEQYGERSGAHWLESRKKYGHTVCEERSIIVNRWRNMYREGLSLDFSTVSVLCFIRILLSPPGDCFQQYSGLMGTISVLEVQIEYPHFGSAGLPALARVYTHLHRFDGEG